jgi:hypothetical protein
MRHQMLALLFLLSFGLAAAASDPLRPSELTLRESNPQTGSMLRRDVAWSSKIPLNRTYAQLSAEEKAALKAHYELIGPNDEPPFPRDGLGPIIDAIQQGQAKRLAKGELKMLVTVGPDGKAMKVSTQGKINDATMARFVATILELTPYKPALCDGNPCTMQYPFFIKLRVDKSHLTNGLTSYDISRPRF